MEYIAEKLVHHSADSRVRALQSLEFKWKYGLISSEDLLQNRSVLRGLLGLSPSSAFNTLLAGDCGRQPPPWHVTFPVVPLSAADDQALFEDNILALVSSSRSSREVQQAAAALLLQLITGLKVSLALARHPELAHSQFSDRNTASISGSSREGFEYQQATGLTATAGPAGKANGSNSSSRVQPIPSFTAAAASLAAMQMAAVDPTCPNSYPYLPMPDDMGGLEGVLAQGSGGCWQLQGLLGAEQQQVDVTAAVVSILLQGLPQELRRSAAEELVGLTTLHTLASAMSSNQHLDALWRLCLPDWQDDELRQHDQAGAVGAEGTTGSSIFDMQLPVACLQLLAALLAHDVQVLAWFNGDPYRRLVPLLPLALHSLHSVRRAAARVLALAVFGAAAAQWRGFTQAAAAAAAAVGGSGQDWEASSQPAAGLDGDQVQAEVQDSWKATWPVLLPEGAAAVLLPGPFLQQYRFPFKVQPVPMPAAAAIQAEPAGGVAKHQQRQRLCVRHLVEQQQLLQAAANKPAAARQLLQDCLPPELQHLSPRAAPVTADDQRLWLDLLVLLERVLATSPLPQGEKVKAAVRKLPDATARLTAVQQVARQLLQEAAAMESRGGFVDNTVTEPNRHLQIASAAAAAACGLKGIALQSAALGNREGLLWWLQQLDDTVGMLIELMESA
eukprot:gene4393-4646_t